MNAQKTKIVRQILMVCLQNASAHLTVIPIVPSCPVTRNGNPWSQNTENILKIVNIATPMIRKEIASSIGIMKIGIAKILS